MEKYDGGSWGDPIVATDHLTPQELNEYDTLKEIGGNANWTGCPEIKKRVKDLESTSRRRWRNKLYSGN